MKNYIKGFFMSFSMFTIIPLPFNPWDDDGAKYILTFYPLVGLVIGLLWYLLFKILLFVNTPVMIFTAAMMFLPHIVTGFLHLDGYMDICDALLSRRNREEKLRILKDSHTGAFAVICLGLIFIVEYSAMGTLLIKNSNMETLILIPILIRTMMALIMAKMPILKKSSLVAFFVKDIGKKERLLIEVFGIIASIFLIFIMGVKGILFIGILIGIVMIFVRNAYKELGGINGDVAGYGLVIGEALSILLLSIM